MPERDEVHSSVSPADSVAVPSPTRRPITSSPKTKPKIRASRACSSCNRQKLRCDGEHPCGRCIILGVSDGCEYLPSLRGKTRKRKALDQSQPLKRPRSDSTENPSAPGVSGTMSSEYAMWRKDSALATHGPTNTAIWGKALSPSPPSPAVHVAVETSPVERLAQSPNSAWSVDAKGRTSVADRLTTLPLPGDLHNPLAVLAEASASAENEEGNVVAGGREGGGHVVTEVRHSRDEREKASQTGYYAPLSRVLKDEAPHIMSLINVHEAETLFSLYHTHLHPHLPFLDVEHSAPSAVARRNNFLFNAICCVAARAFNVVLWERLKEFARFETERLPKEKNIDVVQGHLIYSTWNLIRPKNFEQDMTWLRVGVASRTAVDINLHRVALVQQARDGLPRWLLRSIVRTWLLNYIVDRTLSAQLGKAASMRGEGGIGFYLRLLAADEGDASRDDVMVASLAEWTQILTRAMDAFRSDAADYPSLASRNLDLGTQAALPDLVHVFRKQFRQWRERAEAAAARACMGVNTEGFRLLVGTFRLYDHYARLVVHSFGLERALERVSADLPAEFAEYQTSAIRLIECFEADLSVPGLTRGCPDFVFTVLTYAVVSLLKSTEPRLARLEPRPNRAAVFTVARRAADMLARAAMTSDHLPASQSVFLSRLIQVRSAEPKHNDNHSEATRTAPENFDSSNNLLALDLHIPEPIDFAAFGLAVDADQTKSLWPPVPPTQPQDQSGQAGPSSNGAMNRTPDTLPTDLSSWVAQQNSGYALPGAALGLGVGSFSHDQNMLFTQDSFWRSILEGANIPPNGLV